ncbi:hypothetical protein B0T22DRAFT_34113 [Podospora appendiculata]|uniref:Uncharacterized protein n=1 Tax=Podospora appendiculata TaxID=314037 RepID=A0AAE0XGP3_9PEZI|nr:hypothetical protein B0T22DRAFT_34113 [Podospora appendiculata]
MSSSYTLSDTASTAASVTRYNIAPLTTVFVPPPECHTCYGDGHTFSFDSILTGGGSWQLCTAYASNCLSYRPCLPGTTTPTADFGFYSPGLFCPAGWTTATVLTSSGDATSWRFGLELISRLQTDETAGLCCPSGYSVDFTLNWPETTTPVCLSTILSQGFQYYSCHGLDSSLQSDSVSATTSTGSVAAISDQETVFVPTTFTLREYVAFSQAPIVQLVWRSSDLEASSMPKFTSITEQSTSLNITEQSTSLNITAQPTSLSITAQPTSLNITTLSKSTSITEPPPAAANNGVVPALTTGAIAGIATASVIVMLICGAGLGLWLHKSWNKRRKPVAHGGPGPEGQPATDNQHHTLSPENSGLENQKPELDAIGTVASDARGMGGATGEKAELEASGQPSAPAYTPRPEHPLAFELESTEVSTFTSRETTYPQHEMMNGSSGAVSGVENGPPAVSPQSQGSPFSSRPSPSTMWSPASDRL